jgi:hypothetical protein
MTRTIIIEQPPRLEERSRPMAEYLFPSPIPSPTLQSQTWFLLSLISQPLPTCLTNTSARPSAISSNSACQCIPITLSKVLYVFPISLHPIIASWIWDRNSSYSIPTCARGFGTLLKIRHSSLVLPVLIHSFAHLATLEDPYRQPHSKLHLRQPILLH